MNYCYPYQLKSKFLSEKKIKILSLNKEQLRNELSHIYEDYVNLQSQMSLLEMSIISRNF